MTDEELREFVRSMIRSVELRIDAMFERHGLSTAALLNSSSQAPTTVQEVDNSTEPERIIKPVVVPEGISHINVEIGLVREGSKAPPRENCSLLKLKKLSVPSEIPPDFVTVNVSTGSYLSRSQSTQVQYSTAARNSPTSEKTSLTSADIVDSVPVAANGVRRTPTLEKEMMILAPSTDTSTDIIFVVRDSNQIWHGSGRVLRLKFSNNNDDYSRRLAKKKKVELPRETKSVEEGRRVLVTG
uniref:Uncharacterized protein n=1 Tax=Cannabis sativa TaxID=3483 RepID=A0A803PL53_CANSA